MLESRDLILQAVAPDPGPGGSPPRAEDPVVIRVADAATGRLLGVVRQPASQAWWYWFRGRKLVVFENEDESLLCTLQTGWGSPPTWEVLDADDNHVGKLLEMRGPWLSFSFLGPEPAASWKKSSGVLIEDRSGHYLAFLSDAGRFLSPQGTALGTLERGERGVGLHFAREVEGDPFSKMLLLTAGLSTCL